MKYEARSGSVIDTETGTYIAYCPFDHHGFKLDGRKNAKEIACTLNAYYDTVSKKEEGVIKDV